jgi:hypothetical protein
MENVKKEDGKSIYETEGWFFSAYLWGSLWRTKLKYFCWPQHLFFILGVLAYAVGSTWK